MKEIESLELTDGTLIDANSVIKTVAFQSTDGTLFSTPKQAIMHDLILDIAKLIDKHIVYSDTLIEKPQVIAKEIVDFIVDKIPIDL